MHWLKEALPDRLAPISHESSPKIQVDLLFMDSNSKAILVSFSGIDGSGKSTQIERLHGRLLARGLTVTRLAFWDNVVVLPRLRAGITRKVLGGEQGVGKPGRPAKRNDKNARRWYLTLARAPFYLFDVLSLRRVVKSARATKPDVIIFDRYIYDQIAHISDNWLGRICRRFLLHLAPRPHIAYLLDAEPEVATARKPEYPLEFVHRYRNDYFSLLLLAPEICLIACGEIDTVATSILQEFEKHLSLGEHLPNSNCARTAHPQRISA
jgi:thymidylate kinase